MNTIVSDTLLPWLAIAGVFVLAGTVKGITGMGLPTVAMSLLALWMAPAQAAALLVVPSLMTNAMQCIGPAWKRLVAWLWPLWLGMAASTIAAPDLRTLAPVEPGLALGVVLIGYGAWGLWKPVLPELSPRKAWISLLVGLMTGFLTASTAVFVLPLVPYLQALRLDKATLIQALGLSFTVATLALAARLHTVNGGGFEVASSLVALAAATAGLAVGAVLRIGLSAATFQRSLFSVFIALGAITVWRAL